ncbi:MAG: hypothetical protein PVF75_11010 [Granulosicoccaceae bacterium]
MVGVGLEPRVFVKRCPQQHHERVDLAVVPPILGLADRRLGEIVAQPEFRVDPVHARAQRHVLTVFL